MSVCFGEMPKPEIKQALEQFCRTVGIFPIDYKKNMIKSVPYFLTKIPLTVPMFFSKNLKAEVQQRLKYEKFDLIYIFSSSMAPYVMEIENVPKVIDFIDVDSEKWYGYASQSGGIKGWVYRREGKYLRKLESRIEKVCQAGILVSHQEVSLFKSFRPGAKVFSIGNGVELPNFQKERLNNNDNDRIVFVGVMDYLPNVDAVKYFVREIFPRVIKKRPKAEFFVVGKNPTREVRNLESEAANVHVTGYVPDVGKYLSEAKVAVIPLRIARGIQNKILEAMASGVPVVATTAALEGIESNPDHDLLVADNVDDFALKTVSLLEDKELNQRIARNARNLVERKYKWESKVQELENLLTSILENRSLHN
jgi:sugar transferase (PEP-CTERM/EpsH1 system associated)